MAHEFFAVHGACLPADLHRECQSVGHDVIECVDGAPAGHILDIDDLLLRFRKCVRCVTSDGLQVVSKVAGVGHQPCRILLIYPLPPEIKKEQAIVYGGEPLLHLRLKRACLGVFGVLRKPEVGECAKPSRTLRDRFGERQDRSEVRARHCCLELRTSRLNLQDLRIKRFQMSLQAIQGTLDEVGEVPPVRYHKG